MRIRKTFAAFLVAGLVPLTAACGTAAAQTSSSTTSSSSNASTSASATTGATGGTDAGSGPGASLDVAAVTTEEQLIALIQEAYGDGSLGLHRGHQPVEAVLNEVLKISHEELHSRMAAGQNLAAVAEDLGIDPQTLIDALVASWSPAIDTLLANGTITQDEADQYRAALEEAFTFRVTWDGSAATPTFSGLSA